MLADIIKMSIIASITLKNIRLVITRKIIIPKMNKALNQMYCGSKKAAMPSINVILNPATTCHSK